MISKSIGGEIGGFNEKSLVSFTKCSADGSM